MFCSRPVSLALVGLFVWVTACSSYTQIELGEVADHNHIRVTTTDGEQRDLYHPVVEADSIKGQLIDRDPGSYIGPDPYARPLDEIATFERAHGDAGKTAGAAALTVVVVAGVLVGLVALSFATSRD